MQPASSAGKLTIANTGEHVTNAKSGKKTDPAGQVTRAKRGKINKLTSVFHASVLLI